MFIGTIRRRQANKADTPELRRHSYHSAAKDTGLVRSEPLALMMLTRDIGPWLTRQTDRIALWSERVSQRRALMRLDHGMLKDIGVSRTDAEAEYRKPFWR